MEDMDIDFVVNVPDTPDRLSARRMNRADCVEKESNLSIVGCLGGSNTAGEESLDRQRGVRRLNAENGHKKMHFTLPRENAPLFRRTSMERRRSSSREQNMDKGKDPCSKLPSKSPAPREDHAILDLSEQSRNSRTLEMAFPHGRSRSHLAEGRREGQGPISGGSYLRNTSNNAATSRDNCKGKEKVDEIGFKRVGSVMDDGEGMGRSHGSPLRMEKQLPASQHSIVSPRVVGQKRLVRNGCISPHNIAIRAKQLNENSSTTEQNFGNVISNSPQRIDISKIIAEDNNFVKGKGVVHPHASNEHDMNFIDLSSSPMSNNGEVSGISDSSRDACFEEKGGWRCTRNRSKNVDHATVRQSSRFNNLGCREQNESRVGKRGENSRIGCDFSENQDATETAPVIVSKLSQNTEPSLATNMVPKRQKKHALTSRNSGESSRVNPNDSDIMFLGLSRGSSSSRASSIHIGQHLDVMDLDESSEMRGTNTSNMDTMNDEDSEAKARQVEADEMLARELQEQFYQEVPVFGDGEIDENIAWAIQQEEDALRPTTTLSHLERDQRRPTRNSHVQPPSRNFQNSLNRRGQAYFPTSARMSRLRSRVLNEPRAAPTRRRNFRFPLDMDLDMRLDILEAMEAVIGDDDDMGMASHIFQERDFNENDYEMLLALDEHNHQHGGASINQINSLPLSKVQTENFDEACAVCLETPTIGETIRHLPCLHKFHKECIDPWLSRKTSCPVCKSSIT